MDKKQLTLGTVIAILLVGTTYYVQSLGSRTGCRAGWIYEENGEFESYHKCITSTNVRYEMCFDVYDSKNTENYWCEKGKIIKQEETKEEITHEESKGDKFICNPQGCIKWEP